MRLRPLEPDDLDPLLAEPDAGAVVGAETAPAERRRRLERLVERSGTFTDGRLDLAVEVDGRLAGRVDVRRPEGAMPPGVVELGIGLLARERGRGVGRRAVELLVERLFADPGIHRVQASTALDNRPMRVVLEQVGFTFEGVQRSFMPTGEGDRVDYALYALTRADHEL